jgi:hypothetical protein
MVVGTADAIGLSLLLTLTFLASSLAAIDAPCGARPPGVDGSF